MNKDLQKSPEFQVQNNLKKLDINDPSEIINKIKDLNESISFLEARRNPTNTKAHGFSRAGAYEAGKTAARVLKKGFGKPGKPMDTDLINYGVDKKIEGETKKKKAKETEKKVDDIFSGMSKSKLHNKINKKVAKAGV